MGVGVESSLEERIRGRHLNDLPQVHHGDMVADVPNHGQVMGNEEIGEAESGLKVVEQIEDLSLDRHIERRYGLVGDNETRVESQGPSHTDPLPLASRELVRESVGVPGIEPDQL
jgi:hypothetical protein